MNSSLRSTQPRVQHDHDAAARMWAHELQEWLGQEVELWDVEARTPLLEENRVSRVICEQTNALTEIHHAGQTGYVAEVEPVLVAAIPLSFLAPQKWVAVFPILARPLAPSDPTSAIAELLAIEQGEVHRWCARQRVCPPEICTRLGNAFILNQIHQTQIRELSEQLASASDRLASNFDEISLLHRLTQNCLKVGRTDEDFGRQTIEWLQESLPADGCGLVLLPSLEAEQATYEARPTPQLLSVGEFPLNRDELQHLFEHVGQADSPRPCLLHSEDFPEWHDRHGLHELLVARIQSPKQTHGHLVLTSNRAAETFEVKHLNLLASVAAILGAHCANHELHRQQADFLANVVRALTSAIDAKDPYTSGHSDRVARIAVRLARELNCSTQDLETVYLGGLLHDIGKIGIDDAVLRKSGELTAEEFAHIKQHPSLGCKILEDIRHLEYVLPIVRHHHEHWNGAGYPDGLKENEIPLLARITSVADAFDAMTSSRCYRQGIPQDQVDQILRQGAGQQWDPAVIAAYFRVRQDILQIVQNEREGLSLNVRSWTR